MEIKKPVKPRVLPYVIERLGEGNRTDVRAHLLSLDATDRTLRFGVTSDADAVERYVANLDFERDVFLGARARDGALVGLAHVALVDGIAELGVSVCERARRSGVAAALAQAALREAQRLAAREFRFDFVAGNAGMRRLARKLAMTVSRDGNEFLAQRALGGAPRLPLDPMGTARYAAVE